MTSLKRHHGGDRSDAERRAELSGLFGALKFAVFAALEGWEAQDSSGHSLGGGHRFCSS